MARYIPTAEELKWYEDKIAQDPQLKDFDNWDYLPFHPHLDFPEWFVPIVSRDEWGALPPRPGGEPLPKKPVLYVRYTWVGKEECETVEECSTFLRKLQKTSMEEGLTDLPFNFLIGGKGIVYEGRGWDVEADREERHNNYPGLHGPLKGKTIDIAYIGDMSFYGPSNAMDQAAHHFYQHFSRNGKLDEMVEFIPYRERPVNYEHPSTQFTVDEIPGISPEDREKIKAWKRESDKEGEWIDLDAISKKDKKKLGLL